MFDKWQVFHDVSYQDKQHIIPDITSNVMPDYPRPKIETKNVGMAIDQKYAHSVLGRCHSSLNILNNL